MLSIKDSQSVAILGIIIPDKFHAENIVRGLKPLLGDKMTVKIKVPELSSNVRTKDADKPRNDSISSGGTNPNPSINKMSLEKYF